MHYLRLGDSIGETCKFLWYSLEKQAIENGTTRLELEVSKRNKVGICFYQKIGLGAEGVKRNAFLVNGKYEDELLMAKIIKWKII